MKTLYESILDDEDVLIDKTQKDASRNWVFALKQLFTNNSSFDDILKFLNSKPVEDNLSELFVDFKRMEWTIEYDKSIPVCKLIDKKGGNSKRLSACNYAISISYVSRIDMLSISLHTDDVSKPALRNINEPEFLKFAKYIAQRDKHMHEYKKINTTHNGWYVDIII